MKILKYLKLILTFRQVAKEYAKDNGKDKPLVLSRRFFGVLITSLGGIVMALTGADIAPSELSKFADGTSGIWQTLNATWPHLIALYGVIMGVVGQVKRKPKMYTDLLDDENLG